MGGWVIELTVGVMVAIAAANILATPGLTPNQIPEKSLTPRQLAMEKQRMRLSSADIEERRDAVTLLGSMHHPEASRVSLSALRDPAAIVRASAAAAILSLPLEESAASLIPLLSDKDEFVRRETAYALGKTRSRMAVSPLVERLLTDKQDAVRGAAAVALGQIGDAAAVSPLASILVPQSELRTTKKNKTSKKEQSAFVSRAAAHALGQIGTREGLPTLITVLQNEKAEDDVRRESALALGMIGDGAAVPALRSVLTARDPYLSETAQEALRKISRSPASGK